jgi:hypothetical protein
MTMNHPIFENLEIAFWNTTIPVLTGVRRLRQAAHRGRLTLRHVVPPRVFLQSAVWSIIGLMIGLLTGMLMTGL